MMTLAPGTGREDNGCDADCDSGPMHFIGRVTASSQPSSCEDSCDFDEEYQDPAWLAFRVVIASRYE